MSAAEWAGPEFREQLASWVGEQLGPEVEIEQAKLRPWASVWRCATPQGVWFAKVNADSQRFEAALVAELTRIAPAYVVAPVAVEPARGLLLTLDHGPTFHESTDPGDVEAWTRLLVRAMELARCTAPAVEELVALGVTRPRIPDEVAGAVADLVAELADLGLPEVLCHNDLHEDNAFDLDDGLVFFDFADAVVAHPLSGLLVPLSVLAETLGAGASDARMRRAADAALEVWSDLAPSADLRRTLPAALRLGRVARAESWARLRPDLIGEAAGVFGDAAQEWLARLPDEVPVRFA